MQNPPIVAQNPPEPVRHARRVVAAVLLLVASVLPCRGNPASDALKARGADAIYNLDRDVAVDLYRQAIAADPQDAAAYRGLASALWLSITFRRGNMTVDDYLGKVSRPSAPPAPPPPDTVAAFKDALDHALTLARRKIAANDRDAGAHYELAAAVGLRASYVATVENSVLGAFKAAREAYDEDERVLELDPSRKDAGLIVGTYRYIVAALSLPLRWVAYVAGFGGGKERGLTMIEEAAAYPGDSQTDARLALILLYNREHRYDDALKQLEILRTKYPRNRLMWLESGSTCLRAGRPADAERFIADGLQRFANDTRQRMFGEDALWRYKHGAALAAIGRDADARQELTRSIGSEGRKWVHGRAQLELGRLSMKSGDTRGAREHLEAAARLCEGDNDIAHAEEARRLLKTV